MNKLLFFIVFMNSVNASCQNTYIYDSRGNIIGGSHIQTIPGATVSLMDSKDSTRFVLDSAHIYITAIDKKGDTLWRTDPCRDNKLPEYRVKRPVIVDFRLRTLSADNSQVLYIMYNNTQFGTLDKSTGKFEWMGQD